MGRSPQHGRNVALVMDRDTALVSPQFHVAYDATFDTNERLVMIGDRVVIFAEDIVGWEGSFALREFGIWVIMLECI